MIKGEITYNKIYYYMMLILAFFMPINQLLTSYVIGTLTAIWLTETIYSLANGQAFRHKLSELWNKKTSLLFISFYLVYLAGLIYSENTLFGLNDLSTKLSLLLFPLISGTINKELLSKKNINKYAQAYIAGCILISLIYLYSATINFVKTGLTDVFYYTSLAGSDHPSYVAMYLSFAVALAIKFMTDKADSKWSFYKVTYLTIIMFFSIMIVLLSSKAGIMTIIAIIGLSLIYLIITRKKYILNIILLLIIAPAFYGLMLLFPFSLKRANQSENALKNKSYNDNLTREGTSDRILIWKTSVELIKEHPLFGVGTGDVKDVLIEKYKEKNISYALLQKMNAHNQYLQTFIATGAIGFLILALSLLLPGIKAIKEIDIIYFIFIVIIAFNILFESMLERQAGVVFYAFFNSLLFFRERSIKNK